MASLTARVATVIACVVILCAAAGSISFAAQERPGRQGSTLPPAGVTPAELQRLFDAYIVMQAQQELQLTDAQYPQFLTRVRVLQDVRRRAQVERGRMLNELRRLSQGGDENQIRTQLKALDAQTARATAEEKQALESVDQVLDVRQQARFRVFEETMERRKVELLMRARQANRARNQR